MNRTLLLLCLACVFPLALRAGDAKPEKNLDPAKSYEVLKTAHCFAIGGIGVAGSTSGEELAFRQVLKGPDPVAQCRKLLTGATTEGKLYALLGLRLLDKPAFQTAVGEFKDSKTEIQHIAGCMMMHMPASVIVAQIEKGDYDQLKL